MAKKQTKTVSAQQRKGRHPNSLANLKKFQPGQSGNPKGTPRPRCYIYYYICKYMEMTKAEFSELAKADLTISQRAAYHTVIKMGEGEWQRIREIMDRDDKQADRDADRDAESPKDVVRLITSPLAVPPIKKTKKKKKIKKKTGEKPVD